MSRTATRMASDGISLGTHHWPAPNPRAAVVLVHGLAEHARRYDHVGSALAERGFDTRATDLRGFGMSGGPRAYIEDFSTYVEDLAADVADAAALGVPVVLLGHSMGGLIATLYAQSDQAQPDLFVLSTPSLDAEIPAAKVALGRALVRVAPRFQLSNGLRGDQLSRDPAVGERYFSDPLVHPKSTTRLGMALLTAMDRAREHLDRLTRPTLVIHGGDDTIVSPAVSAPLAALPNVTRIVFDGFRHESFNEEGGHHAIGVVANWIDAQL